MRNLRILRLMTIMLAGMLFVSHPASAQDRRAPDFTDCPECPTMIASPAGRFVMGSPATEPGRFQSEGPRHRVSVRAFALGKYAVTNAEFLDFLRETGYQPDPCDPNLGLSWRSPGHGDAYPPGETPAPPLEPAVCLSWNDAEAYIAWLNGKVRSLPSATHARPGPYRLPSEAEWEYAARAGTDTARWWGNAIGSGNADCIGCGSSWDGTLLAPAGSFGPNPFGLYDMLGNVWQWVEDCWHESYAGAPDDGRAWTAGDCTKRVLRGGSWNNVPVFIRSASRSGGDASGRDFDQSLYAGFRIARSLP